MSYKSARSRACDISKKVKDKVWERDDKCCVLCGNSYSANPNAHLIPRSRGGLGIEQNIVTLCNSCHSEMDQGLDRQSYQERVRDYLERIYPDFVDNDRIY